MNRGPFRNNWNMFTRPTTISGIIFKTIIQHKYKSVSKFCEQHGMDYTWVMSRFSGKAQLYINDVMSLINGLKIEQDFYEYIMKKSIAFLNSNNIQINSTITNSVDVLLYGMNRKRLSAGIVKITKSALKERDENNGEKTFSGIY